MTITVPQLSTDDFQRLRRARVLFGHQSVGANVLRGIELLAATAGVPGPLIVETTQPVAIEPCLAHTRVGRNRDPQGKLAEFATVIGGPVGSHIDVAVLKFCYADVTAATDVDSLFDLYMSSLDALQARHPHIRFVHATVPLTTDRGWKSKTKALLGRDDQRGPADNVARHRYNVRMRDTYGDHLFDIAAVEATTDQQSMMRRWKGQPYCVLNRELSADAGHLNSLGSRLAATEFVRVLAANSPIR